MDSENFCISKEREKNVFTLNLTESILQDSLAMEAKE